MMKPATLPTTPALPPAAPQLHPYEPPRLTGKRALERVTLWSVGCSPSDPSCHVGHP